MKKTYVTEMPNHIGAFLQASKVFAELGVNITRVSYNKAVDSHMLFIDVRGDENQLKKADIMLKEIGYLQKSEQEPKIILVEFRLRDVPGSVTDVLKVIEKYHFNISYISSQENGSGYQLFKMGLFVDDKNRISEFLNEAEKICLLRVIDYNPSEKVLDNSIFYRSFISGIADMTNVSEEARNELLVNANLAMQTLDERGLSPYLTFDSIYCFAKLLSECKESSFNPRITRYDIGDGNEIINIEPPCGSNTIILKSENEILFIDSGYQCYRQEMEEIFCRLIPNFRKIKKHILITHADVDHCGLLDMFDIVTASRKSAESLKLEYENKDAFREQNQLHKPYIKICKVLTMYHPPKPEKIEVPWINEISDRDVLGKIGEYNFGKFSFSVYEGAGGHLPGEIVLIDYEHKIAFTGDIYVNVKDMTPEQKRYNHYAPILMTSVDSNPELCADERNKFFDMITEGWMVFGAHGAVKRT